MLPAVYFNFVKVLLISVGHMSIVFIAITVLSHWRTQILEKSSLWKNFLIATTGTMVVAITTTLSLWLGVWALIEVLGK